MTQTGASMRRRRRPQSICTPHTPYPMTWHTLRVTSWATATAHPGASPEAIASHPHFTSNDPTRGSHTPTVAPPTPPTRNHSQPPLPSPPTTPAPSPTPTPPPYATPPRFTLPSLRRGVRAKPSTSWPFRKLDGAPEVHFVLATMTPSSRLPPMATPESHSLPDEPPPRMSQSTTPTTDNLMPLPEPTTLSSTCSRPTRRRHVGRTEQSLRKGSGQPPQRAASTIVSRMPSAPSRPPEASQWRRWW